MKESKMKIPLFQNMTEQDIRSALQCVGAFQKEYKKEEFILLEEDKVQCVGCVLEGSIEMISPYVWVEQTILNSSVRAWSRP